MRSVKTTYGNRRLGNLTHLAGLGAKVGTKGRRISAIRFAHQMRNLPDPVSNARVIAVWEGIRRTRRAPPRQAALLMPPELFHVLGACPDTRICADRKRTPEPDLTWPVPGTGPGCWWGSCPRCPVTAVNIRMQLVGVTDGPLLRPVSKGNRALARPLHPAAVNDLVKNAVARVGLDPARTGPAAGGGLLG